MENKIKAKNKTDWFRDFSTIAENAKLEIREIKYQWYDRLQ